MFNNLRELIATMPDEKACRDYLIKERWNGVITCPYCSFEKCYVIENGKRFKCGNKACYKKFSVTVGTVFEASNIPLTKWFMAIYLTTAHKKGISSYQLGKDIGVAQKSAWFMLHRIRELMKVKVETKLDNIVEIDETYLGGKVKNMSKRKRAILHETGMTFKTKTMVMGLVERDGNLKLIAMGKDSSTNVLQPVVKDNVDKDAFVITDGYQSYLGLDSQFAGHEFVNHKEGEYVRDKVFHINTIEGAFSHFKRSIYGIYHQVSTKHLSRYCDETMFRYNLRKMQDAERFIYSLSQIEGRLDYRTLTDKTKGDGQDIVTVTPNLQIRRNEKRIIVQSDRNGNIIATYPSITAAAKITSIDKGNISQVLRGKKNSAGGFIWKNAD